LSSTPQMVFLSFVGSFALFGHEWVFLKALFMLALAKLFVVIFARASQYDVTLLCIIFRVM
jgi:hypothetical protein